MLNKIKLFLNILSTMLITFVISTNLVFASSSKEVIATNQSPIGQIIMVVILFGCMYFLLLRPQNKKAKEHQNLIASLTDGDEVITVGGLLGKVNKVVDNFIVLWIADNVAVTVQKQAIAQILPKGTLKSL